MVVHNLEVKPHHTYAVSKLGVLIHNRAMRNARTDLPSLDSTGKVHGRLPGRKELSQYTDDELGQLRGDLQTSVQTRFKKNIKLGHDKAHAPALGAPYCGPAAYWVCRILGFALRSGHPGFRHWIWLVPKGAMP